MIVIRTACKQCGEILIKSADVHLYVDKTEEQNYYEFKCPQCGIKGGGIADERFVRILISNGVKLDGPTFMHLQHQENKEPLSWDDYLDFKLALRGSQIYEELKKFCNSKK